MNENDKTKLKIISLSMEPELHETLKISAKKMGCSVSHLVRELVRKHLDLIVNDGEEIPVILRIPADLKGNEESLRNWLNARSGAIIKALT